MKVTIAFYRPSETPGNDVYYLEVDDAGRTHYNTKTNVAMIHIRRTSVCRIYKRVYPKHKVAPPEYVEFDITMFDNIHIVPRSAASVQLRVSNVENLDVYHTDIKD